MNANPKRALRLLAFVAALGLAAPWAMAQPGTNTPAGANARALSTGKLLVAAPDITDRSWAHTVVLLLHHDENGTLGIAINRPTSVAASEFDSQLEPGDDAAPVFRGGPIAPTQLLFLAEDPPQDMPPAARIFGDVYAGGDLAQISVLASADDGAYRFRLYAGHAEWAPGQLLQEVAAGRWIVVEATPERVFSLESQALWNRLRQATGGEITAGTRAVTPPPAPVAAAVSGLR